MEPPEVEVVVGKAVLDINIGIMDCNGDGLEKDGCNASDAPAPMVVLLLLEPTTPSAAAVITSEEVMLLVL
jgi:hypothetical protein